jgi:hypothetical protein
MKRERSESEIEQGTVVKIVGLAVVLVFGLGLIGLRCNDQTNTARVECIKAGGRPIECEKAITP